MKWNDEPNPLADLREFAAKIKENVGLDFNYYLLPDCFHKFLRDSPIVLAAIKFLRMEEYLGA